MVCRRSGFGLETGRGAEVTSHRRRTSLLTCLGASGRPSGTEDQRELRVGLSTALRTPLSGRAGRLRACGLVSRCPGRVSSASRPLLFRFCPRGCRPCPGMGLVITSGCRGPGGGGSCEAVGLRRSVTAVSFGCFVFVLTALCTPWVTAPPGRSVKPVPLKPGGCRLVLRRLSQAEGGRAPCGRDTGKVTVGLFAPGISFLPSGGRLRAPSWVCGVCCKTRQLGSPRHCPQDPGRDVCPQRCLLAFSQARPHRSVPLLFSGDEIKKKKKKTGTRT